MRFADNAYAQADRGLRCPPKESMNTVVFGRPTGNVQIRLDECTCSSWTNAHAHPDLFYSDKA